MKGLGLFYVLMGGLFVVAGLGDDLTGGAIEVRAVWVSVAFAGVGFLWLLVGMRGLLGRASPLARKSDQQLRSSIVRVRLSGMVDLLVAGSLMFVLSNPSGATGAIVLDDWASPVMWTVTVIALLRGLLFVWPTTPAQIRTRETELATAGDRKRKLDELETMGGTPATGTVRETRALGMSSTGHRRVSIDLEVSSAVRGAYPVTWEGMVDLVHAGQLVPGARVAVRTHPVDESVVEIDWGKAPPTP